MDLPWFSKAPHLRTSALDKAETTGLNFVIVFKDQLRVQQTGGFCREPHQELSSSASRFFFSLQAVVNVVPVTSVAFLHFCFFSLLCLVFACTCLFHPPTFYSRALCCFESHAPFTPPFFDLPAHKVSIWHLRTLPALVPRRGKGAFFVAVCLRLRTEYVFFYTYSFCFFFLCSLLIHNIAHARLDCSHRSSALLNCEPLTGIKRLGFLLRDRKSTIVFTLLSLTCFVVTD